MNLPIDLSVMMKYAAEKLDNHPDKQAAKVLRNGHRYEGIMARFNTHRGESMSVRRVDDGFMSSKVLLRFFLYNAFEIMLVGERNEKNGLKIIRYASQEKYMDPADFSVDSIRFYKGFDADDLEEFFLLLELYLSK